MAIKIAFIGAGSIGFTRRLLTDILSVPELRDLDVRFMDINEESMSMAAQLCQRDIRENGLDLKITTTTNRREALKTRIISSIPCVSAVLKHLRQMLRFL